MSVRTTVIALLISCLPAAGCGTVSNLAHSKPDSGGKTPFGGVRQDLMCIDQAANGELGFRSHPRSDSEQYPQIALMLICAVDLPFSLVGDIITWPYTAAYSWINQPVPYPPVPVGLPTPPDPVGHPTSNLSPAGLLPAPNAYPPMVPPAGPPTPAPPPTPVPNPPAGTPMPGMLPIPTAPPTMLPTVPTVPPAPLPPMSK